MAVLAGCGSGGGVTGNPIGNPAPSTNLGRAIFSLQHPAFNCDAFFDSVSALPTLNIAFVWRTFGEDTRCLERVLADPRLDVVEIHLTNGTCDRQGRRCGAYELKAGYTDALLSAELATGHGAVVERFRGFARDYRAVATRIPTCLVSPMLEADLTPPAARTLVRVTREELPGCLVVWNPLRGGRPDVGQDVTEVHGLAAVSDVVNNDGDVGGEAETLGYLRRNRGALVRFLWGFPDNGITSSGPFIDPQARDLSGQAAAFPAIGAILARVYDEEASE